MAERAADITLPKPTLLPLGDSAILVRFGAMLTDEANSAAIALAARLEQEPVGGVLEVVPNLVSVLLRYDPSVTPMSTLAGELRLRLSALDATAVAARDWTVPVSFDGPDLNDVAAALGMSSVDFIAAHNAAPLRVLATGFAPGFVYCGLHQMVLPRRTELRAGVPAGSILFAAGQTAITATDMPTGWHVIGRTLFRNFDPAAETPTSLRAGDTIRFVSAP